VERHAVLAGIYRGAGRFRDRPDPEDPADVQAMQMVLHIPKAHPPARSALLAAAASSVVALCMSECVGAEGPWHQAYLAWAGARIRKVARRARGAQWKAALSVPGHTVGHADVDGREAIAHACVPSRVGDLDARIKKLQIGGTELDHDRPTPRRDGLPVLWVNSSLGMSLGKTAAQVGHASMLLAGAMRVEQVAYWAQHGYGCAVQDADKHLWPLLLEQAQAGNAVVVRDAGFTEIAPGSITVIAQAR
jgi:peptidyl-tRNA hydrolase